MLSCAFAVYRQRLRSAVIGRIQSKPRLRKVRRHDATQRGDVRATLS